MIMSIAFYITTVEEHSVNLKEQKIQQLQNNSNNNNFLFSNKIFPVSFT